MNGIGYGITPFMGSHGILARSSGGVTPFVNEYSMSFDGSLDYIEVADADNLSFGNGTTDSPFSISAWIKIGQTTAQGIVSKYGSTGATREYLFYITGGKLRLLLSSTNGGYNFVTGTTNLSINTWYHVACTYDGTGGATAYNGMTLYINGIAESVTTANSIYVAMSNTSQNLEIGKHLTNELLGNIDEVSVFNSELSSTDISTIYNGGAPADLTSLSPLSWWRMGDGDTWDGSSWILTDNGSGGNDATSVSMPESARLPITPNSYSQNSFVFDGSTDFVSFGDISDIENINTLSIGFWFKYNSISTSADGLISKDGSPRADGNWYIALQSNQVRFLLKTANGQDALNSTTLTTGTWYHTLCVWNGSTMKIYINGTLNNSISVTNATGTLGSTSDSVRIGRRTTDRLNGNIDEVYIWDNDQSANISTIYGNGVPTDISSLNPLGHWRFGETDTFSTSWTFVDQGSGGNDGTSSTLPESAKTGDQPYVL